jgi:hypothetical protein
MGQLRHFAADRTCGENLLIIHEPEILCVADDGDGVMIGLESRAQRLSRLGIDEGREHCSLPNTFWLSKVRGWSNRELTVIFGDLPQTKPHILKQGAPQTLLSVDGVSRRTLFQIRPVLIVFG